MELKNNSIEAFLKEYEIRYDNNVYVTLLQIDDIGLIHNIPFKEEYHLKDNCDLDNTGEYDQETDRYEVTEFNVLIFIKDVDVYGISCEYRATYTLSQYDDYSFMAKLDNQSIKMI